VPLIVLDCFVLVEKPCLDGEARRRVRRDALLDAAALAEAMISESPT
jgi:hypothetical protein